jgi:hypothetical protein
MTAEFVPLRGTVIWCRIVMTARHFAAMEPTLDDIALSDAVQRLRLEPRLDAMG